MRVIWCVYQCTNWHLCLDKNKIFAMKVLKKAEVRRAQSIVQTDYGGMIYCLLSDFVWIVPFLLLTMAAFVIHAAYHLQHVFPIKPVLPAH